MRAKDRSLAGLALLLAVLVAPVHAAEYLRIFEEEQALARQALDPEPDPDPTQTTARFVVPVPRVTIYPNTLITDDMLVDVEFGSGQDAPPHVFTVREGLVGKISRQTLLPRVAVPPSAVREPFTIKQGQPAVAVFQAGALVISATAVPLESGAVGDSISLRNPESGTTIRGIVQADGTIRVGLP